LVEDDEVDVMNVKEHSQKISSECSWGVEGYVRGSIALKLSYWILICLR
jgi:hypothetical protein